MNQDEYEDTIRQLGDWTRQAELARLDRLIAEEAEDTAQRWFATEVERLAAERHGGPASTHDVALATVNVATRFDRDYDRDAVAEALRRDPEPVGYDYLPLRSAGQRALEAASARGGQLHGRPRPPLDDNEFEARAAALAAESEALLPKVEALARLGRVVLPPAIRRSMRAAVEAIDAVLPPDPAASGTPRRRRGVHPYLPIRPAGWG